MGFSSMCNPPRRSCGRGNFFLCDREAINQFGTFRCYRRRPVLGPQRALPGDSLNWCTSNNETQGRATEAGITKPF
jgi:hypothetical protein